MQLLGAAALATMLGFAGVASSATADNSRIWSTSLIHGRWQIHDARERQRLSARGRPYKTIDIAPCGNGLCGVSVNDNGSCGATLFRFQSRPQRVNDELRGQAVWGRGRTVLVISYYDKNHPDDEYEWEGMEIRQISIDVGSRPDFESRSGSMPLFNGNYYGLGQARCIGR